MKRRMIHRNLGIGFHRQIGLTQFIQKPRRQQNSINMVRAQIFPNAGIKQRELVIRFVRKRCRKGVKHLGQSISRAAHVGKGQSISGLKRCPHLAQRRVKTIAERGLDQGQRIRVALQLAQDLSMRHHPTTGQLHARGPTVLKNRARAFEIPDRGQGQRLVIKRKVAQTFLARNLVKLYQCRGHVAHAQSCPSEQQSVNQRPDAAIVFDLRRQRLIVFGLRCLRNKRHLRNLAAMATIGNAACQRRRPLQITQRNFGKRCTLQDHRVFRIEHHGSPVILGSRFDIALETCLPSSQIITRKIVRGYFNRGPKTQRDRSRSQQPAHARKFHQYLLPQGYFKKPNALPFALQPKRKAGQLPGLQTSTYSGSSARRHLAAPSRRYSGSDP